MGRILGKGILLESDLVILGSLLREFESPLASLFVDEEPALSLFLPAGNPGRRDLRGTCGVPLRGTIALVAGTVARMRELIENFAKKRHLDS